MPYYNHHIHSKLPKIGTTIFTTMSNLANDHGAINLSQGFPDFDVDERLKHLAIKYIKKGPHQYAPMQGALPLREAIYDKVNAMYNASYDVENEITITAGATQAIYTAISAIIKENDEVILFTPASVLCADNSTAISKVYGSLWSNGISILGNKSSKTFIIKLIFSDLFIMLKFTHKIYINEYIENRR